MAMISCPECGKQISDRTFSCPNCGCPINAVPAVNHYNQFSTTNNAFGECSSRVVCAKNIYQEIEDGYKKIFPDRKKRLADHQKIYISFLTSNSKWFNNTFLGNMYTRLGTEIKTVYPEFQTPAAPVASAGGCYVATAVYGSYDCPQVWTLRRFRDNTLAGTWYGRLFIRTYYAISPTLVKWFGKTEWFKNMWKPSLDKLVSNLRAKGVESTPYKDRNW